MFYHHVQVSFLDVLKVLLNRCAANPINNDSLLDGVFENCVEPTNGRKDRVRAFSCIRSRKAKFPQLKDLSESNPRLHRLNTKMMVHLHEALDEEEAAKRSPDFIMVSESLLDAEVFKWIEILTTWELKLAGNGGFSTTLNRYNKKDPRSTNQMSATNIYADGSPATGLAEQSVNPVSSSRSNEGASTTCPAGDSNKRSAIDDDYTVTPSAKRAKFAPNAKKLEPNYQNALYGYEMLSRGIYSVHSLNFLVVDEHVLWIWWYDRQNAIQSSGLNFVEDAPYFIALLLALQRFGMANWGVDPIDFGNNMEAVVSTLNTKHVPSPELVLQSGVTRILDAWTSSEKDLVIEAYWPEQTRLNEAHIIKDKKKTVGEPELIKNLPPLLASIDIPSSNTGNILRELDVQPAEGDSKERVLRLLLFRKLVPLHKVGDQRQVLQGWVQCLKCHYALWNKDTEHGDISVWNLMWDPQNNCGVLNDWDLAFEGYGAERTGTMPFMARELLDDPYYLDGQRLYRHEIESFIWVIIWICFKVDLPSELDSWHSGDSRIVGAAKDSTVMKAKRQYWKNVPRPFTATWQVCLLLLQVLHEMAALEIDDAKLYDTVMKIGEFKLTTPEDVHAFLS
ncbi:hypothetical protein BDQ17DRAFT_1350704 [Cyathus striatus]|nr:hypothetical protein BDQ17DRAFT_1350704 [Cyathus striatus]